MKTFDGETYYDDRLFLLSVCRCTAKPIDADLIETTIYHEDPPADHVWCVATFRNTGRYPLTRVDHFATEEEAQGYLESVEPTVPLISLGGASPRAPLPFAEFAEWKKAHQYRDYDYRLVHLPGGSNPREIVITRRPKR